MERMNGNTSGNIDRKGMGWGWASVVLLGVLAVAVLAGIVIFGGGEKATTVTQIEEPGSPGASNTMAPVTTIDNAGTVGVAIGGVSGSETGESAGGAEGTSVVSGDAGFKDGETAYFEGRYHEAANLFSAYVQSSPKSVHGQYMLGLSLWKNQRPTEAETAFRGALALNPAHVKSLVNYARVLIEERRFDEALQFTTRAVGIEPSNSDAYRVRGRAFHNLGVTDGAIESYERAIALDGDDAWALNNLGLILIEAGRFEDAVAPLARATRISGDVALFQNNLGIALERTGHYGVAKDAYARALEIDSTFTRSGENLARVAVLKEDPALPPIDLAAIADGYRVRGTDTAATQ